MSDIYQIVDSVIEIKEVPIRSETPDEATYRIQVENFLQNLKPFSSSLNVVRSEMNGAIRWINDKTIDIDEIKNETINAELKAKAYADTAEQKANEVESVVIPQEATYSKDEIDTMFNSLITAVTALQYAVAVLSKGAK